MMQRWINLAVEEQYEEQGAQEECQSKSTHFTANLRPHWSSKTLPDVPSWSVDATLLLFKLIEQIQRGVARA